MSKTKWGHSTRLDDYMWAKLGTTDNGGIEILLGGSESAINGGDHVHFIKERDGTWYYNPRQSTGKRKLIDWANYPDANSDFNKLKQYMRVSNWSQITEYDIEGYLEELVRKLRQ